MLAQQIKEELNTFKMVRPDSLPILSNSILTLAPGNGSPWNVQNIYALFLTIITTTQNWRCSLLYQSRKHIHIRFFLFSSQAFYLSLSDVVYFPWAFAGCNGRTERNSTFWAIFYFFYFLRAFGWLTYLHTLFSHYCLFCVGFCVYLLVACWRERSWNRRGIFEIGRLDQKKYVVVERETGYTWFLFVLTETRYSGIMMIATFSSLSTHNCAASRFDTPAYTTLLSRISTPRPMSFHRFAFWS